MNHPRVGSYAAVDGTGFPFIENGQLVQSRIDAAAKYDDVILDLACVAEHPLIASALRAANPSIRIHAYVVLIVNQSWGLPFFQKMYQIVTATNGLLICTNGKPWSFMNVNVANPTTMDALATLILNYPGWDGRFIDLLIPQLWSAAQYGGETLDWQRMGFASEQAFLDSWKTVGAEFMRRLSPSTSNYGWGFPGIAQGNMYEEFHRDWPRWIESQREGELHLGFPSAWITSGPVSHMGGAYDALIPENQRRARFGDATACLFGGLHSFGRYEGDKRWQVDRLSPEWNFPHWRHPQRGKGWLGSPTAAWFKDVSGLYCRWFDHGIAVANPTDTAISYRGPDKLRPIGGAVKKQWSIPPHDALIAERV